MDFFTEFVPKHLVYLLEGAVVTLELCFVSMALGIAIGVGLGDRWRLPAAG